jgi:hypothetical protein
MLVKSAFYTVQISHLCWSNQPFMLVKSAFYTGQISHLCWSNQTAMLVRPDGLNVLIA